MLAIQFQLTEIASLAKHNIELTSTVLTEARRERRAAVNGDYTALTEMIGHARHVGSVSPAIFMEVQGSKRNLEAHWETMRGTVRSHVDNLGSKRSHKQHREYLLDNGEAILADAQALLLAQSSWFMYQALWAGYLLNTADSDPRDAELLQRVINDARQLHAQSLAETDRLLDQVGREFAVMRVLEGKRTLPFSAERRASKDVGRMARQLQESLATIRVQVLTPQEAEVAAPTISVFEDSVPDVLLRVLRLRLEPEERLAALASAVITASNGDRWTALAAAGTTVLSGDSWTAVTDQRVLIMRPDDLKRYGVIEREVPVEDIRYVRTRDRGPDKGPAVDLITKDDNITFEFRAWAKSDDCRLKAERFGDVLGQFMNLPASEIPTFRVRELESGR